MDIFNKYKSHFLAAIYSLIIYTLLFLFLFIKPFNDNSLNNADKDLAIQFQLLEDLPLPELSPIPKSTTEVVKTTQPKENQSNVEDFEKSSENLAESVQSANTDSVLLAEITKSLAEIQNSMPTDSLPEESVQPKNIANAPKNQPTIADNNRNYYEERQFYRDNYRTIMRLKVVYPYVVKTKEIVDNLNSQLEKITDKKEKQQLIKKAEKELFEQFEKDVRKMSYAQGKILLKLIARETNQSAYGLIKKYKGGLPATFWYGVGLIFQENLKVKYDSLGEDALLEKIVQKYKQGNF